MTEATPAEINFSLEKSELISAIGREIDRNDRLASASGYTNWVVLAAIGLMLWEALRIIKETDFYIVFAWFMTILISKTIVSSLFDLVAGVGEQYAKSRYFFYAASSYSDRSSILFACISFLSFAVGMYFITVGMPWYKYVPISFFSGIGLFAAATLAFPKMSVKRIENAQKPGVLSVLIVFIVLFLSLFTLLQKINISDVLNSSSSFKVAVLFLTSFFLGTRQFKNSSEYEKREHLRRLELEVSLEKIDIKAGRERFETLMLGITAGRVLKPSVEKVILPLDDAQSLLEECKKLTFAIQDLLEARTDEDNNFVVIDALKDKVLSILDVVEKNLEKSNFAYKVLLVKSDFLGMQKNEVSDEIERIKTTTTRVLETAKDLRNIVRAFEIKKP